MPKYDISDIKTISFLDAIRSRPWMYLGDPYNFLGNPKNLLSTIIGIFTDSFLSLGVKEFTICETQNFFIIKSKQDWLKDKTNRDVDYYFREDATGQQRAEPFLSAFYFPFYTNGDIGEHGNRDILDNFLAHGNQNNSEVFGRTLIISKKQNLPNDQNIIYKRPEPSLEDLKNENRWLEVMIQSNES